MFYHSFISGCIAGCVASFSVNPFDGRFLKISYFFNHIFPRKDEKQFQIVLC